MTIALTQQKGRNKNRKLSKFSFLKLAENIELQKQIIKEINQKSRAFCCSIYVNIRDCFYHILEKLI